ncbi:MAG: AI-2E family transporter [Clostridia bacterium]|nr:AI-2E family transporter [Clostridia bacterium]
MNRNNNHQLKLWMPTIVFAVLLFAAVTNLNSIAGFMGKIWALLSPMGLGFALALILNVPLRGVESLIRKLDKKRLLSEKLRSTLSLVLVLLLTPLAIFAIVMFIVPEFVEAIDELIISVNQNKEEIIAFTSRFGLDAATIQNTIDKISTWISSNMRDILNVTLNVTFSTAMSIFSSLTSGLMCIMLAIYMLADRKRISRSTRKVLFAFLPKKAAAYISRTCSLFISTFSRFLSMQCLEAFILAVILFAGMLIFKLPYAMSISSLTMIFALIPYVGAFVSFAFGAIIILLESPQSALIFIIVFLIVQQIEGNIIYPRVVGESVGLPAYLTLFAVSIGGSLMGIAGMMLFVPIVSVAYTLIDEAVNARLPGAIDNLFTESVPEVPESAPASAESAPQTEPVVCAPAPAAAQPAKKESPAKKQNKGKKRR